MTTARLKQKSIPARAPAMTKSRRVRTGCLTCRERHLKCDETLPNCLNCRKSNRQCKRGIRLNFLDITVHTPSRLPSPGPWTVQFRDESRQIASEYPGGLGRYAYLDKVVDDLEVKAEVISRPQNSCLDSPFQSSSPGVVIKHTFDNSSPPEYHNGATITSNTIKSYAVSQSPLRNRIKAVEWAEPTCDDPSDLFHVPLSHAYTDRFVWQHASMKLGYNDPMFQADKWGGDASAGPRLTNLPLLLDYANDKLLWDDEEATLTSATTPATVEREFLRKPDEVRYMQVYVEEVAIWMDSFDKEKHFSHSIPYRALKSPMLLNSLLACGVWHLSLHNPKKKSTAEFYYNTATTQLLRNLENPDCNKTECSAAAVILKLYEHVSKKQRRSHAAGPRALIKHECGWSTSSNGVGAACFWLEVYLEVLNCLESTSMLSWHPDQWGLDMDLSNDGGEDTGIGNEELWVQRIFYILARLANFRLLVSTLPGTDPNGDTMTLENRLPEWRDLKRLCDRWNDTCPRTMHPLGYEKTKAESLFPKVWLPKREALFGRLLYHTAQCILTQTNPMEQTLLSDEMSTLQLHHAREVCGIVAHTEDRGIGLFATQSLTIASKVLVHHGEQMEVLRILGRIQGRGGRPLEGVEQKLKAIWGWETEKTPSRQFLQSFGSDDDEMSPEDEMDVLEMEHMHEMGHVTAQFAVSGNTGLSMPQMDVSTERLNLLDGQPFQGWYEPPSQTNSLSPSYSSLS